MRILRRTYVLAVKIYEQKYTKFEFIRTFALKKRVLRKRKRYSSKGSGLETSSIPEYQPIALGVNDDRTAAVDCGGEDLLGQCV